MKFSLGQQALGVKIPLYTKGVYMSYKPRTHNTAHSGKTAMASILSFSSIEDVFFAIGIFGTIPELQCASSNNIRASNNGLFNSLIKQRKIFDSSTGELVTSLDQCKTVLDKLGFHDITGRVVEEAGDYFFKENRAYVNSVCRRTLQSAHYASVSCHGHLFIIEYMPRKDGIFVSKVYLPYSVLRDSWAWDGCPNLVIEGVVSYPTHFENPLMAEKPQILSDAAVFSKLSEQENEVAWRLLLLMGWTQSQALTLFKDDTVSKLRMAKQWFADFYSKNAASKSPQTRAIVKVVKDWLTIQCARDSLDWSLSKAVITDPTVTNGSSTRAVWIDKDHFSSIDIDINQWLLSFKGLYFIDSLTSIIYTSDEYTKGAAGARGLNTKILLAMACTTYSHCVLLYAPSGTSDPLADYDLTASENGDFEQHTISFYSDFKKGVVNLPLIVTATSRETERDTKHIVSCLSTERPGELVVNTNFDGGPMRSNFSAFIDLKSNTLVKVIKN